METTFMTIHNLSPDANILYVSESIVDILGYQPHEVVGRSCFQYFHPDEVPFARGAHDRGVKMDKAAMLYYARIAGRDGQYVTCECVFSVVYDVLVACTSIYRQGMDVEQRNNDAQTVRRLFTSSPKDPRYHMLEHLSAKFRATPQAALREPRAALILNRFTRTLTVMYATNAVSSILGVSPEQFKDKSFYECIQENCLPEAIRCLESAKANDSIAYLRFWYRDPRRAEDIANEEDAAMREASQSSDSEDGGVELDGHGPMDVDANPAGEGSSTTARPVPIAHLSDENNSRQDTSGDDRAAHSNSPHSMHKTNSHSSSAEGTDLERDAAHVIFDQTQGSRSSTTSVVALPEQRRQARTAHAVAPRAAVPAPEPYEIEAVVSCTSDGLVVILRRARPMIPDLAMAQPAIAVPQFANGLFAAPWGANPIRPHVFQPNPVPFQHGLQAPVVAAGGPPVDDFMNSIREVAVFAWSLAGINGNIASYGRGVPRGEAQPPGGLPIWDPYGQPSPGYQPPENQALASWTQRDIKMNNAPASGNQPPYQYPHQEHLLRMQGGFADASDRPGSSAHAHLNRGGYVFQGPGSYENNGYENAFGPMQGAAPPPWSAAPAAGNLNLPPTTSAPGGNDQLPQ